MTNRLGLTICLFMLWLVPASSGAAELDIEKNILCDLDYFQMCEQGDLSCNWGQVVDIDGKQTVLFDVKEMVVTLFEGEMLIDRESITSKSIVNDVLYLHGTNPDAKASIDGSGWAARIEKFQGKLVGARLADTSGSLIFGVCRNQ